MMKVLFLPNWKVHRLQADSRAYQAPDKQVAGRPYWFFRHFPEESRVDVVDYQEDNPLRPVEKRVKTYLWQGMKAFVARENYDVVISHGAQSGLMYALLRTMTCRRRPAHVIIDVGSMNGGRSDRLENLMIRSALRSRPYSICHSRIVIENYARTYPDMLGRTSFVPFGVDVDDFSPSAWTGDSDYVLSFGASKRDYPTLLKAWAGIRTRSRLRLIGCGPIPGSAPSNVEALGTVPLSELKEHIRNALFIVIPLPVFNYSYGQMSFLQSMSMGKAVVVTRTPSSVDYLEHGRGAFLVKPYDVEDMREKIGLMLHDPELARQAGVTARQFVRERFPEKTMAEGIHHFLVSTVLAN